MRVKPVVTLASMVIIVVFLLAYGGVKELLCHRGFRGIETDWRWIGGCQVEARPGVWVPRENYRVM